MDADVDVGEVIPDFRPRFAARRYAGESREVFSSPWFDAEYRHVLR
jgi:hypothetical protein